ncbi:hypothetical protein [Zavarzinella formosa]|uniref:hypothetical protein n=1 Tax=Zavarzinella formosa TaxID=360055 RepID=UPI0003758EE1|nr:hypothetical protein [Zavarzinella formosa]
MFGEAKMEHEAIAIQRRLFNDLQIRMLTLNSSWLTPDVRNLAAGCDDVDILNHGRQPGEHVRGCWVVDLTLGKK